jgi:hypothetical protein
VLGIDLGAALAEGRIIAGTYAAMITRCRGCALVEACEAWLARTPSASAPPPGCCHGAVLSALRPAVTS